MSIRVLVFCVLAFVNSTFAAPPKLKFTYWKVGQGDANEEPFITDTETTCMVEVRVGYEDEQPANAKLLNYYSWTVTMTHGFEFAGVSWQDGATGMKSTTFSWFGLGNGDAHQRRCYSIAKSSPIWKST